ncbi:MAG: LamG domain-containing protein [Gaiellaceae bacterium]
MSATLILLLPLLVLSAVALLAFAGCTPFTAEPGTEQPPTNGGDGQPKTYEEAVRKTAGLIAYWRLDETKLPPDPYPAAKDTGGVNNTLDGTYNGTVDLSNVEGALAKKEPADKGTTFGGNGYVEVPFSPLLSPPMALSLEVWIQPGALTAPGIDQHVVAFRDVEGPVNSGFEINLNRTAGTSQIQGRICTGGEGGGPQASEAYLELDDAKLGPGGPWRHVVMTFDGSTITLYVDGDAGGPHQTQPVPVAYRRNLQQPFRIGTGRAPASPAPGQPYVGAIDEVALYSMALDVKTVKDHYAKSGQP